MEVSPNLITVKHVDDVGVAGEAGRMDKFEQRVEKTFGGCKINQHPCTCCSVRDTKLANGVVTMGQEDYVKQLRPAQRPALTGSAPEETATKR